MNHIPLLAITVDRLVVLKDGRDVVGIVIRGWLAGYDHILWVWLMLELAKEDGLELKDFCMLFTYGSGHGMDQSMERRSCDGNLLEHIQDESCEVDQLLTVGGELIEV